MAEQKEIGPEGPDQSQDEELDGKQKGSAPAQRKRVPPWLRSIYGRLPRYLTRKPVVFALAALLLGGAAAWGFLGGPGLKGSEQFNPSYNGEAAARDGLRQEELSRFYIPLPESAPFRVMVVDWSVVWDALSAVRFRKMEVSVRDLIYNSLTALAAKDEGLSENIPAIEESIGRALRDGLRGEAVTVRVKEVKTY